MDIPNMRQFQRVLAAMVKDLPTEFEDAAHDVARDWIGFARGKAHTPEAIKVAAQMTIGNVEAGALLKNRNVAFYGEEFGGQSRPATMMFPPHKGQEGYWLFPAARENARKLNENWERAMDAVAKVWHN